MKPHFLHDNPVHFSIRLDSALIGSITKKQNMTKLPDTSLLLPFAIQKPFYQFITEEFLLNNLQWLHP